MKPGSVYLMANHRRGQTYLGVTSNLIQRVYQHRNALVNGHSKRKGCCLLVWFQHYDDLQEARACEFRMKTWKRAWKLRLVEESNPDWRDLYDQLLERSCSCEGRSVGHPGVADTQRSGLRRSTAR